MSKNIFQNTINKNNTLRPPVWFMRQAGRYHQHYQNLKQNYSFIDICKKPDISCEAAMGPIRDFDFDAAILFSDILFPLEVMGMGLEYSPGPKLSWHLRSNDQLSQLKTGSTSINALSFQADAIELLRQNLPTEKGLIGFVGGPFTLYCYAVEGSHKGKLDHAITGLTNGLFDGFSEKLNPLLIKNMIIQANAGADCIAILDTCAGDASIELYKNVITPQLNQVICEFKKQCPNIPVVYYSKNTTEDYWSHLVNLQIDCIGVDWNVDICDVLKKFGDRWSIQGNFNPHDLLLDTKTFKDKLENYFSSVLSLNQKQRQGWICGLGHGILPKTPENHVRHFISRQRELFSNV